VNGDVPVGVERYIYLSACIYYVLHTQALDRYCVHTAGGLLQSQCSVTLCFSRPGPGTRSLEMSTHGAVYAESCQSPFVKAEYA
jgi:hypothetical protein